ncbi:GTPase IMAP family member 8-like [Triplophysa rosa]|uniref:GTPase IMAP family member 8-like n=1 Tax=Triplophysa rosa TaxID=992332 RepID=UPI002545FCA4|nr:GTPase IMAP family member 8-like [Triplophysa rosa]XP_057188008.1 GTPase IMAP family member 8-like [Triplophysa rosa]
MSESPKFRIVLVGKTGSGKSSAGNILFGEKCFEHKISAISTTNTCEKQKKNVAGEITEITDTPGLFDTSMNPEELKCEIEKCVVMSAPGPHVFLLVIRLDVRFTEEEKNAVKWIQENFGEEAAHYTIILFTHADALENESLDAYIEESLELQTLVKSCGDRYHSFNNKDMENRSQVTHLLEKIEKMVNENGGKHYSNEMYREAQERIDQRKIFWSEKPRIVLLGKNGSGKTTTGNIILGMKKEFADTSLTKPSSRSAIVEGRSLSIIDTPQLCDSSMDKKKSETVLKDLVVESDPGPHVFLLVINVKGSTQNTVKCIQGNIGEDAVDHTIIVFTHVDQLSTPLDEFINKNNDIQALIESCGGRFHSSCNVDFANRGQVTLLLEKIEKMMETNGWKCYTNEKIENILITNRQLKEIIEKYCEIKRKIRNVAAVTVPSIAIIGAVLLLGRPAFKYRLIKSFITYMFG